jgi:hypothetical protein
MAQAPWIGLRDQVARPRFPDPKDSRSPRGDGHGASASGAFDQGPAERTFQPGDLGSEHGLP